MENIIHKQNNYIIELDGIRAIAALSVMLLHFIPMMESANQIVTVLQKYHSIFQFGVPIFFVLSGFLITRILINAKNESGFFSNFYIKRSLRIFPLYYLICIISLLIIPNLFAEPIKFSDYWPNLIYFQNFFISFHIPYYGPNHFWSLAVEEHFYLLWPLIIYYVDLKNLKKIIILVIILEPFLRTLLIQRNIDVYYLTVTRLDELLYGCLLAVFEVENKKISKKNILIGLGLLLVFIALFLLFTGTGNVIIQCFKYSFFGYLFFILVGFIALNNSTKFSFLKSNCLVYTGKISYGLYIYHPFVFYLVHMYLTINNPIVDFCMCFGLTYFISSISFYLFEKPLLKLKYKFIS